MPADHLTHLDHRADNGPSASAIEQAVLHVLTGTPLDAAVVMAGIEAADLAEAVEVYQRAGRTALAEQATSPWWQIYLEFLDWASAEQDAVDQLAPLLHRAESDGLISAWWFIRKQPCWRLRLRPGEDHTMKARLGAALDDLVATGKIRRWRPGIYEAETTAFGGPAAMETAHDLFGADSRAFMGLLQDDHCTLGRRELSLLLCSVLLQTAGLEWYEQGDVWDRVARERQLPADVPSSRLTGLGDDLLALMRADTAPGGPLFGDGGPAASAAGWADAFRRAGQDLAVRSRAGTLQRGLREILSYHIIFHWNRCGIPARQQSVLAASARAAIFGLPAWPSGARLTVRQNTVPESSATAIPAEPDQAMTRFPLVSQPRLRCPDLETRIRHVRGHALSCHLPARAEDRIDRACTALNLAALIAADCAMPSYAVELCEQQFQLFQAAWPVSGRTAIASLQPWVNLARLSGRAGDPEGMYQMLDQLYHAVHHGGRAEINGRPICFDGITATAADGTKARSWLQDVLRQDGTRALAATGNWSKAAMHAAHYDRHNERLRESRQSRIIAHSSAGDIDSALVLLDTSVITGPWEHAVGACLRIHAHAKAARPVHDELAAMLAAVQLASHQRDQNTMLFRIRLGLTAIDLTLRHDETLTKPLRAAVIKEAEQSNDAYSAQEILNHTACRNLLTPSQAHTLEESIERAALGRGAIPPSLLADLTSSIHTASAVLEETLGGRKADEL